HSAAFDQIETLCSRSPVKISYGESERTSKMFPTLVNMGVQHLQPVVNQLGGVKEWMEVKDLAFASNIDFSSGGYSLYTSSLMATAPGHFRVEYLHAIMHGLEEYFSIYPGWKSGCFQLPEIEGIGVRVDWDYCHRANKIVRSHHWDRTNVKKYLPTVSM
ncbi:MAG TPA: enolase C-terminal domain-like protein, partial [Flavisolibacter sp.]|nr:enolase C-terminal domain-like protein [Flavisolibacter sp.]